MPRIKGHSKCEVEQRKSLETLKFNSILMAEDLEMVALLINQEKRRRENPSEALQHAEQLICRLSQWNGENVRELDSLVA
jgi:hypothetical protein